MRHNASIMSKEVEESLHQQAMSGDARKLSKALPIRPRAKTDVSLPDSNLESPESPYDSFARIHDLTFGHECGSLSSQWSSAEVPIILDGYDADDTGNASSRSNRASSDVHGWTSEENGTGALLTATPEQDTSQMLTPKLGTYLHGEELARTPRGNHGFLHTSNLPSLKRAQVPSPLVLESLNPRFRRLSKYATHQHVQHGEPISPRECSDKHPLPYSDDHDDDNVPCRLYERAKLFFDSSYSMKVDPLAQLSKPFNLREDSIAPTANSPPRLLGEDQQLRRRGRALSPRTPSAPRATSQSSIDWEKRPSLMYTDNFDNSSLRESLDDPPRTPQNRPILRGKVVDYDENSVDPVMTREEAVREARGWRRVEYDALDGDHYPIAMSPGLRTTRQDHVHSMKTIDSDRIHVFERPARLSATESYQMLELDQDFKISHRTLHPPGSPSSIQSGLHSPPTSVTREANSPLQATYSPTMAIQKKARGWKFASRLFSSPKKAFEESSRVDDRSSSKRHALPKVGRRISDASNADSLTGKFGSLQNVGRIKTNSEQSRSRKAFAQSRASDTERQVPRHDMLELSHDIDHAAMQSSSSTTWAAHLDHGLVVHVTQGLKSVQWKMKYSSYDPFRGLTFSRDATKQWEESDLNAPGILHFDAEPSVPLFATGEVVDGQGTFPSFAIQRMSRSRDSSELLTRPVEIYWESTGIHEVSAAATSRPLWRFVYTVEEGHCATSADFSRDVVIQSARIIRPLRFSCSPSFFDAGQNRRDSIIVPPIPSIAPDLDKNLLGLSLDETGFEISQGASQSYPNPANQQVTAREIELANKSKGGMHIDEVDEVLIGASSESQEKVTVSQRRSIPKPDPATLDRSKTLPSAEKGATAFKHLRRPTAAEEIKLAYLSKGDQSPVLEASQDLHCTILAPSDVSRPPRPLRTASSSLRRPQTAVDSAHQTLSAARLKRRPHTATGPTSMSAA